MPNALGQPQVVFSARGRAVCRKLGVGEGHLTLSDEDGLVVAVAVLMRANCMNTLVFDIETVPDVELGRKLYDVPDLDDATVAKVMLFKQQQARRAMLPPPQQRVIAISGVMKSREGVRVFSLGDEQSGERDLVQRFFDGLERYSPTLVSWNGSGFDLPVLGYRALRHGVNAARYWELGENDREFRYNNYLSRYHWRHVDLMDVLSATARRPRVARAVVAAARAARASSA